MGSTVSIINKNNRILKDSECVMKPTSETLTSFNDKGTECDGETAVFLSSPHSTGTIRVNVLLAELVTNCDILLGYDSMRLFEVIQ